MLKMKDLSDSNASLQDENNALKGNLAVQNSLFFSLSHEMRTPLNSLLGSIDLTLHSQLSSSIRDEIQIAKISSNLLLQHVNNILDFGKYETNGELITHPENV